MPFINDSVLSRFYEKGGKLKKEQVATFALDAFAKYRAAQQKIQSDPFNTQAYADRDKYKSEVENLTRLALNFTAIEKQWGNNDGDLTTFELFQAFGASGANNDLDTADLEGLEGANTREVKATDDDVASLNLGLGGVAPSSGSSSTPAPDKKDDKLEKLLPLLLLGGGGGGGGLSSILPLLLLKDGGLGGGDDDTMLLLILMMSQQGGRGGSGGIPPALLTELLK